MMKVLDEKGDGEEEKTSYGWKKDVYPVFNGYPVVFYGEKDEKGDKVQDGKGLHDDGEVFL